MRIIVEKIDNGFIVREGLPPNFEIFAPDTSKVKEIIDDYMGPQGKFYEKYKYKKS